MPSVFRNRLKKNMRLQSDPTIIYGLVGGKGALDGPILREDLDRETAYNTYKINGLPPTPIANPGRASIEAVLRPANSKDLYFVADGTGGHVFAATLDEHNKNVFKWRKIEREIARRKPPPRPSKKPLPQPRAKEPPKRRRAGVQRRRRCYRRRAGAQDRSRRHGRGPDGVWDLGRSCDPDGTCPAARSAGRRGACLAPPRKP